MGFPDAGKPGRFVAANDLNTLIAIRAGKPTGILAEVMAGDAISTVVARQFASALVLAHGIEPEGTSNGLSVTEGPFSFVCSC